MRKSTPFENTGFDFCRVLNEIQARVLVMSAGSELTRWLLCGRLPSLPNHIVQGFLGSRKA